MTNLPKVSVSAAFAKFSEGASDLLEALQLAPERVVDAFTEAYDFEDEFGEVVAKIQNMETEFLYNFRNKVSKKAYVIIKEELDDHGVGHILEMEYFEEGFDVIVKDTITFGQGAPTEIYTWEEFEQKMIAIPEELYNVVENLVGMCLDTCDITSQIINQYKDMPSILEF